MRSEQAGQPEDRAGRVGLRAGGMGPVATARLLGLRLLLGTGSLLLACIVVELGLRLFHPIDLPATDTFLALPGSGADFEADKPSLVAGAAARVRTAEFDFGVRINSRGLRERETPFEKPAGAYRILVLGDSQTFGWGVGAGGAYARLLERDLEGGSRRVETVNAGVPGMGTAHELFFLEDEGWRYHPDAVVLGFFFNDVTDNAISRLYRLEDGRLVRHPPTSRQHFPFPVRDGAAGDFRRAHELPPAPPPREPSFWIRHSHLARLLRQGMAAGRRSRAPDPRPRSDEARELTSRLLLEVDRQCRERGVTLLILLLPAPADCAWAAGHSLRRGNAPVLRLLPDPGREVLDLMPAFQQAGCRTLFFRKDGHLNPTAHRLVAAAAAARLRELVPELRSGQGTHPIQHRPHSS